MPLLTPEDFITPLIYFDQIYPIGLLQPSFFLGDNRGASAPPTVPPNN